MTKRLVCLMLGLLMLLVTFTGCSDKGDAVENVTNEASRFTTTLNMWVVTEEGTDPAQAAAVNEAINRVETTNNDEMQKITGALGMPGLPGLF